MKKSFYIHHLIISALTLTVLFSGCSKKSVLPPQSKICMDTVCSINAFDYGTEKLYADIFKRLDEIEKVFSPTLHDSEVCKINRMAGISPVKVSEDFLTVLSTAQKISRITKGALDVTAGPLIDLWGINTDHQKIPTSKEIEAAKEFVGYEKIQVDGNNVFLPVAGMSFNFGAVVKGYAADEIVSIMKRHRVKRAIIDLGGNIYAFGRKADNIPWVIGIKNPKNPNGNPMLKVYVKNSSIVTSGNYERYFEQNGKRYHHILNTETGMPAERGVYSVTIICKKSIVADCLSTASFILGAERIYDVISTIEKEFKTTIGCVFIYPDNRWGHFGKIKVMPY